jgi:uncharacterized protein YkwD
LRPRRRPAALGFGAAILLSAGCALPLPLPLPPPAEPPPPPPASGAEAAAIRDFADLANRHRQAVGCGALADHTGAATLAQRHSEDMVRRGYFSHTTPEGATPFDRLRAAGIGYSAAAENIASGQPTGRAVLDSWLRSAGHRSNLENCAYTHHGVGLHGTVWTHLLLRPR